MRSNLSNHLLCEITNKSEILISTSVDRMKHLDNKHAILYTNKPVPAIITHFRPTWGKRRGKTVTARDGFWHQKLTNWTKRETQSQEIIHTFPTYWASGPMCSSNTKNWFQIQPRLGLWCTSVSPLASLVWFLAGTLAELERWLAPENLWMKQRHTRKGQRQAVVDSLMAECVFVSKSLRLGAWRSFLHRLHHHHWPPLRRRRAVWGGGAAKSQLKKTWSWLIF